MFTQENVLIIICDILSKGFDTGVLWEMSPFSVSLQCLLQCLLIISQLLSEGFALIVSCIQCLHEGKL